MVNICSCLYTTFYVTTLDILSFLIGYLQILPVNANFKSLLSSQHFQITALSKKVLSFRKCIVNEYREYTIKIKKLRFAFFVPKNLLKQEKCREKWDWEYSDTRVIVRLWLLWLKLSTENIQVDTLERMTVSGQSIDAPTALQHLWKNNCF